MAYHRGPQAGVPERARPALTRRSLLRGMGLATLGGSALIGGWPAWACDRRSAVSGPVFLDYSQEQLDAAYDQLHWVDVSIEQVIDRAVTLSATVRRDYRYRTFAYGKTPDEVLDVFLTDKPDAPVHVFVHGGTWRKLGKEENAFPAPTFVDAGAHYVALNFSNIPSVRLPAMVDQVRRAVAWVHAHARSFGGDPDRIFVSGHSSGGHLAAMVLTTNWRDYDRSGPVVAGGLCISGMYELYPVQQSFRGDYLQLSGREVAALSPGRHLDAVQCPIVIANGSAESPEFRRQARHVAADLAVLNNGANDHRLVVARGLNHFDMWFSLSHPGSAMGRTALAQMGLTRD